MPILIVKEQNVKCQFCNSYTDPKIIINDIYLGNLCLLCITKMKSFQMY
jgi:hypothetical protein